MKSIWAALAVMAQMMPAAMAADGARLYASCAACHGTAGAGAGQALPVLAGQPQQALVASLQAFKAGTRPATIMQQIARGYSDDEIVLIAAYLAAQKPVPGAGRP